MTQTSSWAPVSFDISDLELRLNHQFVNRFETLRKESGYRDLHDAALGELAEATGIDYQTLRTARNLRNAIAHGDNVNRDTLRKINDALTDSSTSLPASRSVVAPTHSERAFRIHAWLDDELEQQMIANGFVSVGGNEIGDLADISDAEQIRQQIETSMTDRSQRAVAIFVGYWRRFLWEASNGDFVVLPMRDRTVAIGVFTSGYHYVETADQHTRHRRNVHWLAIAVPLSTFADAERKVIQGRHTIQEFRDPNSTEQLSAIASRHAPTR